MYKPKAKEQPTESLVEQVIYQRQLLTSSTSLGKIGDG